MFSATPVDIQLEKLVVVFNQLDKGLREYLLEQSRGLLKIQNEKKEDRGGNNNDNINSAAGKDGGDTYEMQDSST